MEVVSVNWKAQPLFVSLLLLVSIIPLGLSAQTLEPQEVLFVPWGDDGAAGVRHQDEPGCRIGPQSIRVEDGDGTISILDPLDAAVKCYLNGTFVSSYQVPSDSRDFLWASSDEYFVLAGNRILHYRHGNVIARFGPGASLPLIRQIGHAEESLIVTNHDGSYSLLSHEFAAVRGKPVPTAVRRSPALAEVLFDNRDGGGATSIELPVPSGNLGGLQVVGTDARGRVFLDIHLVEQAVPLEVRREIWILDASGERQGLIHIPTHYFTRMFRDLELTPSGDLYHMISAEDGIHVLKWSLQGISGDVFSGKYPVRFRTKLHYNFQTDNAYDRETPNRKFRGGRATVTRAEALATAETYAQHSWTATADNISDGVEMAPDGNLVETPGWIVIGLNDRIPYKWGGTDTLAEFDGGIAAGNFAGDIHLDDSSSYAHGVDCSGFICRCWNTVADYTTREMVDPAYGPITLPYSHWDEILPGDAIHKEGHVRMAVESFEDGSILVVESAGSATNWSVGYTTYLMTDLEGYSPRYYVEMDGAPIFGTITSAQNGNWTDPLTWLSGVVPTSQDDVMIAAGDTITVAEYNAECKSVTFGGESAQIKMYSTSRLNVYGDFTLFSTSHCVFDEYWSSNDAKIRFTGSAVQTLNGWNPSGGSTSFRDVIVDKDGGRVTTDGTDMRLGIQNSLEIIAGRFELAEGDDIEGRWATSGNYTGNALPNVIVYPDGEFYMLDGDGAHHMRSDYDSGVSTPIGVFSVFGSATFRDGSTIEINLSGVDIESGGKLITSTGMGNGQFDCGAVHIKPDGELENYTTSDCWGASAVVTLDEGGLFDTKGSTTVFPAAFNNSGTVRYSREGTTDQAVVDMDYKRLLVSLDPDNNKNWVMAGNHLVADTLRVNYSANLVLTAVAPQTLSVGSLLWLTSGLVDNSDANVALTMADGGRVQRAVGVLTDAPVFAGQVDVRYTNNSAQVTTGPEVPTAAGVIDDFEVSGDASVVLSADIEVGGVCATSGNDLVTGPYTVTLGAAGSLAEPPGFTVLGTVAVSRTAAQSLNQTFGNVGLEILADGAAPGVTGVVRTTGTARSIEGDDGIERSFTITPSNNAGLDATVVFHYDESELNGLAENTLRLYESFDDGASWSDPLGTVDEAGDAVTATGISSFALLTAGEDNSGVAVDDGVLPERTAFVSQHPNPFNPATRISFDLEMAGPVEVGIFDVRGQHVATLARGTLVQGRHSLTWSGLDDAGQAVASGVYFCRLSAAGETLTIKMLLAR